MTMKIGIITFHRAQNYGAVLQAYALLEKVSQSGHSVAIIDYRQKTIEENYRLISFKRAIGKNPFKGIIRIYNEFKTYKKRKSLYEKYLVFFKKRFHLQENKVLNSSLFAGYDLLIIGSDQIWNPFITNGFDPIYWGYIPSSSNIKIVTYAASLGITELTNDQKKYISKALANFSLISVREHYLKDLLTPLTNKLIYEVVDPTLLLTSSEWKKIITPVSISVPYVLVYQLRKHPFIRQKAEQMAKEINGVVIELSPGLKQWPISPGTIIDASPTEFLAWIASATCVVTSAFHGTVFSIIFNRSFYTFQFHDFDDSRVISLLNELGLSERLIDENSHFSFSELDYTEVDKKIENLREYAVNFLNKCYETV